MLSLSYKCVTYLIYGQQIKFSFVRLKTRVNRPIMKPDGKNIISVFVSGFFTIIVKFSASFAQIIYRKLKMLITNLKTEPS